MHEPMTDTFFGNPVFAGLAAFSATSVTLAAVSWLASPVFGCRRQRAGWRVASGQIVLAGWLSRWGRAVRSGWTRLSGKWDLAGPRHSRRKRDLHGEGDFQGKGGLQGNRGSPSEAGSCGMDGQAGEEILPGIDFEALQRELDEAFAPVGRDRGKT